MPGHETLEATAQNAVAWLTANRRWFEPDNVTLPGRRDKPVVELAVLLLALREAGSSYDGVRELTGLVREVASRPDRRNAPRPRRGRLVAEAFLFAAAFPTPGEDRVEHRRLQRLVDLRLLDTLERPCHRVMEDRLALEWAGLRHALPSWQVLARGSILGAGPNPAFMDEAAAYQLTHVVMYLTAFGSRGPHPRVEPGERTRQRISTLLVRLVGDRHWDLVGELLLSWVLLELGPSPVCESAWAALLREVHPDGSIAQPRLEGDRRLEPDASFQDRYHPTLVLALAADAWRRKLVPLPPRSSDVAHAVRWPELREMADVEAAWLASMLEKSGEAGPRVACNALVGLWICGVLSEQARERLPAATAQTGKILRAVRDWSRMPAGLALVVHGLLKRSDSVPSGLAAFVEVAAQVLRASPPDHLRLCEKRVLMHGLGLASPPERAPLSSVIEAADAAALDPTAENIERLLLTSESSAAYGTQPVHLTAADGWITELLLALAAEGAHAYDLVSASRLARASVHLDAGVAGRVDLVEVLLAHEHPAGGFGLFGHSASESRHGGHPSRESDLRLRLSVDALWTVAEAATPWRLTSAIGSPTETS